MSQLSVPSALFPVSGVPTGVQLALAPVTDSGNPITSANQQLLKVNASSLVDAVAESDETKYFTGLNDGTDIITFGALIQVSVIYELQSLNDPLVDTGHTLRYLIRKRGIEPTDVPFLMYLALYTTTDTDAPVIFDDITSLIPQDTFALIERPLTILEVQDFRSKNGYDSPVLVLVYQAGNNTFGPPIDFEVDTAFFQLEVPGAGPAADIEITGSGGIELSGGIFSDVIGEGGIELGGEAVLVFNQITGTGGIEVGGDAIIFANAIEGTGGIQVGGSAVLVLSADISGIYALTPGFRHDVLYDGVNRLDVKIPNPIVRTALIGN